MSQRTANHLLRAQRRIAGFRSASAAARAMGLPLATYTQHESGAREMAVQAFVDYSLFFAGVTHLRDHVEAPAHETTTQGVCDTLLASFGVTWRCFADFDADEAELCRAQIDRVFRFRGWPLPAARRPQLGDPHAAA